MVAVVIRAVCDCVKVPKVALPEMELVAKECCGDSGSSQQAAGSLELEECFFLPELQHLATLAKGQ